MNLGIKLEICFKMFEIGTMCCVSRNLYNKKSFTDELSAVGYFEHAISNLLEYQPYVEQVSDWIIIGFDDAKMIDYILVFKNATEHYQNVIESRLGKLMERYEVDSVS